MRSVLAQAVNQIPDEVFRHVDAKIWGIQPASSR